MVELSWVGGAGPDRRRSPAAARGGVGRSEMPDVPGRPDRVLSSWEWVAQSGDGRVAPGKARSARSGLEVYRRRRKFFWRRLLVALLIATFGAVAWSTADHWVGAASATRRSDRSRGALASYVTCAGAVGQQAPGTARPAALASAEVPEHNPALSRTLLDLPGGGATGCPHVYVALPGDTIWAIAEQFSGGGDPRPLEYRLEAEIGGGVLQPGQRLTVP